jgi:hypothetical protein
MSDKNLNNDVSPYGPYSKRLLPNIVDHAAVLEPERLIGVQAKSSDISDGFNHLTMKDLSHASNFTAYLIESQIGKTHNFRDHLIHWCWRLSLPVFELTAIKAQFSVSNFTDNMTLAKITRFSSQVCAIHLNRTIRSSKKLCASASFTCRDSKNWRPMLKGLGLRTFMIPSYEE